jgi:hypothetical protein
MNVASINVYKGKSIVTFRNLGDIILMYLIQPLLNFQSSQISV